jgi:hypothetical protein
MNTRDPHYTTAFGASIDIEIAGALRAGMSLELIYCELSARTSAVANEIVSRKLAEEDRRCAA